MAGLTDNQVMKGPLYVGRVCVPVCGSLKRASEIKYRCGGIVVRFTRC